MKKSLALFLVVVMAVSMLIIPTAVADDTPTLNVMIWCRSTESYLDFNTMDAYKQIEAETGIHANFTKVMEADWDTKLNLAFASGEIPDIIIRGEVDDEKYGVDEKILLPLNDYVAQMPNYLALLDYDPATRGLISSSDGNMYYFAYLVPQNINMAGHFFINQSWLDALGLDVPTTAEELEAVYIAFRDQDPNGNGEQDEIPFTSTFLEPVQYALGSLLNFWGIPMNNYLIMIDNDQKVTVPMLQPGFRDAMETLSRWYEEGLLDPECISQDASSFNAKLQEENIGSFWNWRLQQMGYPDFIVEDFACILPVSADGYTPQVAQTMELPTYSAYITTACEDVDAALAWIDAQFDFDTEMEFYNTAGMLEIADNGKYNILGVDSNSPQIPGQSAIFYAPGQYYFDRVNMPSHRIEKMEYCQAYTDAGFVEQYSYQYLTVLSQFSVEEQEELVRLFTEIEKYVEEAITRFITGGVTDDSWNTFISNLDKLKVDRYIELYQNAYDAYLAANAQ